MPIFTSRFSPERSLVGNFVASRTRENEDAESREKTRRSDNARSRSSQQAKADRFEITNRQQNTAATVRAPEQSVETRTSSPVVDQQVTRQLTLRKASQEAGVARSNLGSPTEEPNLPIGSPAVQNSPRAATSNTLTQENFSALQSALTNRLDVLVERLSDVRAEQSVRANTQENVVAAQNADPEALAELADAIAESEAPTVVPVREDEAPVEAEEILETRIDQLRDQRLELANNFVPPAPPAREEQTAELREDLKTISSGLQADAAIESQRTVAETARNTQATLERETRQTVRENQSEITNLQTTRRQLDQEAQRTDQAIRQLQSETARLKNGASSSGTALNILAQ